MQGSKAVAVSYMHNKSLRGDRVKKALINGERSPSGEE